MLKPQVQYSDPSITLSLFPKPFIKGNTLANFIEIKRSNKFPNQQRKCGIGFKPYQTKVCVIKNSATDKQTKMKATVTINLPVKGFFSSRGINRVLDRMTFVGKTFLLELVSAELDSNGREKPTISGYAHWSGQENEDLKFEAEFVVPPDFGEVGAVFVENKLHTDLYLKDIVLDGFFTTVTLTCNSWIHSRFDNKKKRFFFSNKSYLPSETPNGLIRLREEELMQLRGNGQGERKKGERIYDYNVYNDLGSPDDGGDDMARPVLGGNQNPYPRRCRTGRPFSKIDPNSESRGKSSFYVPRDEEFSEVKQQTFSTKTISSLLHALVPSLDSYFKDEDVPFPYFTAIDSLFDEGINLPPLELNQGHFGDLLPNLFKSISDTGNEVLKFETPQAMERDKFFWLRDEEFARQTLAGLNPCKLELVTEWPLKSSLDPAVYGPSESAITTEMVERQIKGLMTVDEAMKQKKLFMLDYHDILLPFVRKVRELNNTTLYGSRALFFLTPHGTLTPVAIELIRPPMDGKPQWKEAYAPSWHATGVWLWRLAKAHVLAHDSGYHQLISHWLRTHCCTEPYIIAANRQLSEMHPIYRLLHPHFRYTMEINALARRSLINAGGTVENCFAPGKYSMLFSSVIYDKEWRFDHQGLPNDLIKRGLAVVDPSAPHGLKLTIEDYPYANDGLVLWDILKEWASDYVNHYYPQPEHVLEDEELQAWWSEIRYVGHGDKKDESWWPELKTPAGLIEIVTTIMWTTSGLHAAVNFGQYAYAGYFPNRPTIARINMPTEDPNPESWKFFLEKPEAVLLTTFPSQLQAVKVMAVIDILSTHSPDEEYLGQEIEPAWVEEPHIRAAFEKFTGRLMELEAIIDERNADFKFKNRNGAGVVPYELFKPNSESGVTGKGVPYSISI